MEEVTIYGLEIRFKIYLILCITVYIHEYFAPPAPKNEYRIHWERMRKER